MTRQFQFSLKWLFVATLVVAAFFAGRHFEHRQRLVDREHYAASLELLEAENEALRKKQSNPFIGSR